MSADYADLVGDDGLITYEDSFGYVLAGALLGFTAGVAGLAYLILKRL